jgi:hypothetical protein
MLMDGKSIYDGRVENKAGGVPALGFVGSGDVIAETAPLFW